MAGKAQHLLRPGSSVSLSHHLGRTEEGLVMQMSSP